MHWCVEQNCPSVAWLKEPAVSTADDDGGLAAGVVAVCVSAGLVAGEAG